MKKLFIITLFVFSAPILAQSQQAYFQAGKSLSTFDYKNTKGEKLNNLFYSANSFMSLGYRNGVLKPRLSGLIGLSLSGYGAVGSDNGNNNYMEWNLSYIGINVGLDYDVVEVRNTRIYLRGESSLSTLVQGTQRLNDQIFRLSKTEEFKNPLINIKSGIGCAYAITRSIEFYAQYIFSKGVNMKSSNPEIEGEEALSIVSHNFGFGILLELPTYPYKPPKYR
ncbi:MAG: hypothetical protein JXR10_16955 [Cyclobacteriaceae bacterium]